MSVATDWAAVGVTVGLGAVGLWLGHSFNRRRRAEVELTVAQKRFDAYSRLWTIMGDAPPMDRFVGRAPLSTEAERRALFDKLTSWYFGEGNGMLLSEPTRTIYFRAKENLVTPTTELPPKARERVLGSGDQQAARAELSIRQLSLLRTATRADLSVFARIYGEALDPVDREFLKACRVDLNRPPWNVPGASKAPRGGERMGLVDKQRREEEDPRTIWEDHQNSQAFEHELINRKTTWLLTTQGLLFTAYGVTFNSTLPEDERQHFQFLVAAAGLLIGALLLVGIGALIASKAFSWWRYRTFFDQAGGLPGPLDDGKKLRWGVRTGNTVVTLAPDVLLPVVFIVIWALLL